MDLYYSQERTPEVLSTLKLGSLSRYLSSLGIKVLGRRLSDQDRIPAHTLRAPEWRYYFRSTPMRSFVTTYHIEDATVSLAYAQDTRTGSEYLRLSIASSGEFETVTKPLFSKFPILRAAQSIRIR